MHRRPLQDLLDGYRAAHPHEAAVVDRFRAFVDAHEDCLLRTCVPGHVTASTWILDADLSACLLTLHRKLGKWLQLGGHVDGETEPWRAALREAQEESGMARFGVRRTPLDLDIHPIPARGAEPAHLHLDVRFLLVAEAGQAPVCSAESVDVRFVPVAELDTYTREPSVLRLQEKTEGLLAAGLGADTLCGGNEP